MPHNIVWRNTAQDDLRGLYFWIADQADFETARSYTKRIEDYVLKLTEFPNRGTPRDDLVAGMRTLTYRRRTVIAYRVADETVEILRVLHGARDIAAIFLDGQ